MFRCCFVLKLLEVQEDDDDAFAPPKHVPKNRAKMFLFITTFVVDVALLPIPLLLLLPLFISILLVSSSSLGSSSPKNCVMTSSPSSSRWCHISSLDDFPIGVPLGLSLLGDHKLPLAGVRFIFFVSFFFFFVFFFFRAFNEDEVDEESGSFSSSFSSPSPSVFPLSSSSSLVVLFDDDDDDDDGPPLEKAPRQDNTFFDPPPVPSFSSRKRDDINDIDARLEDPTPQIGLRSTTCVLLLLLLLLLLLKFFPCFWVFFDTATFCLLLLFTYVGEELCRLVCVCLVL